ncbi:MAG: NAD-dependent DNA ligase LigA [Chitinophagales bacterium]|nr:NAD-dependent DNA ligase LigA [Chitinophagales bacterium]
MYNAAAKKEYLQLTQRLLATEAPQTLEAADEIVKDLRDAISFHDWNYYIQSQALIADQQYDYLFKMLKQIEARFPDLLTEDSPTQRVAHGLSPDFPPVEHNVPMLSLDNGYDESDLREFDNRIRKLIGSQGISYTVEPKFDGSSIALVYENDRLVRGATRGDGQVGEDITPNVKTLRSIPLTARFSDLGIAKIELRGEALIKNTVFAEINNQRREQGLKTFQNARNTASGALRTKDPGETARRGLEAFMYQIGYAIDAEGNNLLGSHLKFHSENVKQLQALGFKVPTTETKLCANIEEVIAFCEEWERKRNDYEYEIDGMVVKLDDIKKQELTGYTSHHPRWAIAFKFKARQAKAKLLHVEYQVGRTGAITPVAKIEPTPLAGVTIVSISLHNEDFIREKDIRLGDTVIVERAGDVIPYIVGPVPEARTGEEAIIHFPDKCPTCETALVKPEGEAAWRCVNFDCPSQQEERLIHFVSKDAMDIEGLGRDIVRRFMAEGLIQHVTDIYQLDYRRIGQMEGWGQKSVENLQKGVEASKENPSWRLLVALGIRHVGTITAKELAKKVISLLEYQNWDLEQLMALEDIGPKVAESIHEFFHNAANIDTLEKLASLGVNISRNPEADKPTNDKLGGKTFLFTGSLTQFSRDKAKELVESNGGKLLGSVSKNLDYLVVGTDAGSKLEKAQKIPTITILNEQEFLEMIA